MPLVFLNFPYPVRKNLVDQMTKTDLVRVSLQSHKADMALKDCGKNNVSFYNLDREELRQLSEFDRAELFLREAARQGTLPEWSIELSAQVSNEVSFKLSSPYFINNFEFSIEIDLFKNIDSYSGVRKNLMIGDYHVPIMITNRNKLISFWNNKATGLISVLQFFSEAYGLPVRSLNISGCESPNNSDYSTNLRRIVRACSQLDIRRAYVVYHSNYEYISEIDYTFILENIAVNGAFRGYCKTSDNFQFNKTINAKSISIRYGHWFKIENLLSCKRNDYISVDGSKFTKNEVQTFLRQWKAKEFPELKSLNIDTRMRAPSAAIQGFRRHTEVFRSPDGILVRLSGTYIKGYGQVYGSINERGSAFKMEVLRSQQ
ncbi:unnamed protein product [Caenorhabditis brenneri]